MRNFAYAIALIKAILKDEPNFLTGRQWLRRAELASAIVGASRPEQVHANASASGIQLSGDVLSAVDEALGDAPVKQPTLAPFAREGVKHR